MITEKQALLHFGKPGRHEEKYMFNWTVPSFLRFPFTHVRNTALGTRGFPTKIYLNKSLEMPLATALWHLITRQLPDELRTWDGCYMIRNSRGLNTWSLHSWGLAIDVNASSNRLGQKPKLSDNFVKCFTDAGFDWGGHWQRPDGMHFQLGWCELRSDD